MKNTYLVTVDVTVRVKVKTTATSYEEAYENTINEYDNASIKDFISDNWDADARSIDEVDCEILDE